MQSHIVLYIVWFLKYYDTLLTILFVIFTWVNLLFGYCSVLIFCWNIVFFIVWIFFTNIQYYIGYCLGYKFFINIVLGIVLGLKKGYCPPLPVTRSTGWTKKNAPLYAFICRLILPKWCIFFGPPCMYESASKSEKSTKLFN